MRNRVANSLHLELVGGARSARLREFLRASVRVLGGSCGARTTFHVPCSLIAHHVSFVSLWAHVGVALCASVPKQNACMSRERELSRVSSKSQQKGPTLFSL
eukprot:6933774-Prymnesium_polylepis.1